MHPSVCPKLFQCRFVCSRAACSSDGVHMQPAIFGKRYKSFITNAQHTYHTNRYNFVHRSSLSGAISSQLPLFHFDKFIIFLLSVCTCRNIFVEMPLLLWPNESDDMRRWLNMQEKQSRRKIENQWQCASVCVQRACACVGWYWESNEYVCWLHFPPNYVLCPSAMAPVYWILFNLYNTQTIDWFVRLFDMDAEEKKTPNRRFNFQYANNRLFSSARERQ